MKLINTKTHLIGKLSIGKTKVKCETLGKDIETDCLVVYVEKNGVLARIHTYNTIKELIDAEWRDYK